jgi:Fic family protein
MTKRTTGRYVSVTAGGEKVDAFVPFALPPARPPVAITGKLDRRLREAERSLVRLDLAGDMVPSLDWFIYAFVRKEAVISSQIEGTQTTLLDLLAFEAQAQPAPDADIEEVTNYLKALNYARAQIASERGLPLSMRLLNEAHKRLMRGVRGASKQPGDVRRTQNWIGGSRPGNAAYVPSPPHELPQLLTDLEKYIHADGSLPKLVRAGLLHAQFETIHPYLDGNGRIGRLLIALLLEHWGLLKAPLLYLSLFFKRHRAEYYRRLDLVRTEGDWEGWLDFFLDGVATIAGEAVASARDLFELVSADRASVLSAQIASVSALRLLDQLLRHPIVTIASAMQLIAASKPTATRAIEALLELGILAETTGRKRDRSFAYRAYMEQLRSGTELDGRG